MEKCKEISDSFDVPEFLPKKLTIKENDNDDTVEAGEDDDKIIKDCEVFLNSLEFTKTMKINIVEFEKDVDRNHHIDFITAVANLRARNYKIKEGSRH